MADEIPLIETEITKTFDLNEILEDIDEYDRGEFIESTFDVNGYQMRIELYPQGYEDAEQDNLSVFLVIDNAAGDTRNVTFSVKYGTFDGSCTEPAWDFLSGNGWHFNPQDFTGPLLECKIKLLTDSKGAESRAKLHNEQLEKGEKMYKLTMETGDISLRVKVISDEETLYSPPIKKRRIETGEKSDEAKHEIVKVNSVILRASSPVLDAMLRTTMKEKKEKVITIQAKSVKVVRDLVFYMCTGTLPKDVNPLQLLPLGHLYQMDYLCWLCSQKMIKDLEIETFVQTVNTMNKYDIECGFEFIADFGARNLEQLRERDDFMKLPCSFRKLVLRCDKHNK